MSDGVLQSATTAITADAPDPSVVGQAVMIEVEVTGTSSPPVSGQAVISATTGESCTDASFTAGSGNTALFSCSITFNSVGNRDLTAVYSGSATHADSSSVVEAHDVIALPTLSINDVSALEGTGGTSIFQFTLTRSHAVNDVSVQVDSADGTAIAGSDYTAIGAQNVTMPAGGALTATVTVTVNGDTVVEPDETFFVNLSNVSGATLSDAQSHGSIQNDDAASIALDSVTQGEGNAGSTSFVFTATLIGSVQDGFTVPVSSADGTGTAGSDYTVIPGATFLSFAGTAGLTQTVTVSVSGDTILEADENFTVTLGSPSNAAVSVSAANGTGTIQNDDSASIAINNGSLDEGDTGSTNFVFTATLTGAVQDGFTVPVSSADGTAATAADYTAIPGGTLLTFAGTLGETQTLTVNVSGDTLYEYNETFAVTLGTPSNAVVALTAAIGTGTILNDDVPPTISIASPSQNEGNSSSAAMDFVVSLSTAAGRDISFIRATADGTAITADNDYGELTAATATIVAGQTSLTIPVTINGDTVYEGDESFALNLSAIDGATPMILSGTGTIVEDDQQTTTTTIISHLPTPSVVGEAYAVDVQVAGQNTSPLGTVTMSDGSASCGPIFLTAGTAPNSSASCSLSSTTAGTKTLTATYTSPSSAFTTSSGTVSHDVNPAATTISVSGPSRSRINEPSAFSFSLATTAPGSGTPTGTITLSSGASSCMATLPITTCNLSFNALGDRTVSASYLGDGNYTASASSGPGDAQALVFALADIVVSKTDGISTYQPGDLIVYTVQLSNIGPDTAANLRLRDALPVVLINVAWTCVASGGASCSQSMGSGDLDVTIPDLPVAGLLSFTIQGNVQGSPPELINTAQVELPADATIDDPEIGNNNATDTDLLDALFRNGFEDAVINAPNGGFRLPSLALRSALDVVARAVIVLEDAQGDALRVYARVWAGEVQYALAQRDSSGALKLAEWRSYDDEPTLRWSSQISGSGWVIQSAELR